MAAVKGSPDLNLREYKHIEDNFNWYISNLVKVHDKGDFITLIEFTNKSTGEVKTLNPKAHYNKFYEFLYTHYVSSSNTVFMTPIKAARLVEIFGKETMRIIRVESYIIISLGKLGFTFMRDGDVNLHEDLETLRVLNVKEHNSLNTQIHPLLNSYYIEDITNTSIKLVGCEPKNFDNSQQLLNHINSHLMKRSNKPLASYPNITSAVIYTLVYKGNSNTARYKHFISIKDDIGYRGYHTWIINAVEMRGLRHMLNGMVTRNIIELI